jgi:hypothetical protein
LMNPLQIPQQVVRYSCGGPLLRLLPGLEKAVLVWWGSWSTQTIGVLNE